MPKSKNRRKKRRSAPPIPPPTREKGPSPRWYVVTMAGLIGLGTLVIVLNYITILPASPSNLYLFGGLAAIGIGFAMTTNYR